MKKKDYQTVTENFLRIKDYLSSIERKGARKPDRVSNYAANKL